MGKPGEQGRGSWSFRFPPRPAAREAYRRVLAGVFISSAGLGKLASSIYLSLSISIAALFPPPLLSYSLLSKMAAVARSFRPFASRMLSQKLPLAPACRVSPVAAFPRGSVRCFSQSPLCMNAPDSQPGRPGQCNWLPGAHADCHYSPAEEVHRVP